MDETTVKKPKKPRGKARLIEGKCIVCGARCQQACPTDAIAMSDRGEPIIALAACIGCGKCVKICPAESLEMVMPAGEEGTVDMSAAAVAADDAPQPAGAAETIAAKSKGVWVFVEQHQGEAHPVSWELLGVGRNLANDLAVELSAFVLGSGVGPLVQQAFGYGADRVYTVDDPVLARYRTVPYLRGHRLDSQAPAGDRVDGGDRFGTRSGRGSGHATRNGPHRRLHRLVGRQRAAAAGADASGVRRQHHGHDPHGDGPAADGFGAALRDVAPAVSRGPNWPGNRRAVHAIRRANYHENFGSDSVGRRRHDRHCHRRHFGERRPGHDGPGELQAAGGIGPGVGRHDRRLARGRVGGLDSPRTPSGANRQDRKAPAIHRLRHLGAIQHLVGMQDSEHIIAINKDATAPILEVAHLGIVGDALEIVPAISDRLRKSKAEIMPRRA